MIAEKNFNDGIPVERSNQVTDVDLMLFLLVSILKIDQFEEISMTVLLVKSMEGILRFIFVYFISVHMYKFWGYISIYVAPNILKTYLFVLLAKLNICIDILFGI